MACSKLITRYTPTLFTLACLGAVGLWLSVEYKMGALAAYNPGQQNQYIVPESNDEDLSLKMAVGELQNRVDEHDMVLNYNTNKLELHGDKIRLLGTIANENAQAARYGSKNRLTLNADWTISRMPYYLRLNPESHGFLMKHLR